MDRSAEIDTILDAARESFPAATGALLVLTLLREGLGRATVEFQAAERHANPIGTPHGGVLCYIADAAMGVAYSSTLADGEPFTTVELKIDFFRPVRNARLHAEAWMVRAGRSIGLVEWNVLDEKRRLVTHASAHV